ncbi:MAG: hypothetical protein ABH867_01800 [Patescibacteria group bacterium]|nr:hypothetical protein [Patescibacteria group bacterium]
MIESLLRKRRQAQVSRVVEHPEFPKLIEAGERLSMVVDQIHLRQGNGNDGNDPLFVQAVRNSLGNYLRLEKEISRQSRVGVERIRDILDRRSLG